MKFNLEREIRFINKEPGWALQEFDKEGEKIGSEYQPWDYSQCFTASELRYHHSIEIDEFKDSDDEKEYDPVEESEIIVAVLHPGYINNQHFEDVTSYSMFGTDREVKNFTLQIKKVEDDGEERCSLWGSVSYTYEIDYRYENTEDEVIVYLWLSPDRFRKIVDLIQDKQIETFIIRIGHVHGFYSDEPSISIDTENMKILPTLPSWEGEEMNLGSGLIAPVRLGEVGKFYMSILQRDILKSKQILLELNQSLESTDDHGELDSNQSLESTDDHGELEVEQQEHTDYLILAQLVRNEAALMKLRVPIWFIFVLLLLLLIKWIF